MNNNPVTCNSHPERITVPAGFCAKRYDEGRPPCDRCSTGEVMADILIAVTCGFKNCQRQAHAMGLCEMHYHRMRRHTLSTTRKTKAKPHAQRLTPSAPKGTAVATPRKRKTAAVPPPSKKRTKKQ